MFKRIKSIVKSLISRGASTPLPPDLKDRRQQVRFSCRYEVEVKTPQDIFRCVLRDLGPGGALLETEHPLAVGQLLKLSYRPKGIPLGRQRLKSQVVWVSDNLAGVQFVDLEENIRLSWAMQLLTELGYNERSSRRRSIRVDCKLPAVVRIANPEPESPAGDIKGEVLNIGTGGVLLHIPTPIKEKSIIYLAIGPHKELPIANLLGRVLRCRTGSEQTGWLHSIRFMNKEGPEVDTIKLYVTNILQSD